MESAIEEPYEVRNGAVNLANKQVDHSINEALAQPVLVKELMQCVKRGCRQVLSKSAKRLLETALQKSIIFRRGEKLLDLDGVEHTSYTCDAFVQVIDVGPPTNVPEVNQIHNAYVFMKTIS